MSHELLSLPPLPPPLLTPSPIPSPIASPPRTRKRKRKTGYFNKFQKRSSCSSSASVQKSVRESEAKEIGYQVDEKLIEMSNRLAPLVPLRKRSLKRKIKLKKNRNHQKLSKVTSSSRSNTRSLASIAKKSLLKKDKSILNGSPELVCFRCLCIVF